MAIQDYFNPDLSELEKSSFQIDETVNSIEQEVQNHWGHWLSIQICPYRAADNKIDSGIDTLVNTRRIEDTR